ncbi:XrtA/PEP-CTERM system histidine kinase PrsK [Methylococcus sp. EFPC2]|uniref:XrtA/PEP-CTERM system histidine kinase PrsK n=1 Tax=Methylococcus sp. EFPC2 TaxID=2812648 RepID=UPI001967695E|nr:XrtA/PEP-CTERM system histidine kinase PrsK [Methylococcus sp. EFPC2]QSA98805.1 PEP-CTERM system histidine kinase PrsK [Methylococcus sp. EFPC2]
MSITLLSYLAGFAAYTLLTILLLINWRGQSKGRGLIGACVATSLWAGVISLQDVLGVFPTGLVWTLEVIHVYLWLTFFSALLHRDRGSGLLGDPRRFRRLVHVFSLGLIAYIWLSPLAEKFYPFLFKPALQYAGHIGMAVVGLVLVEQFYRNARLDQRWRIKFLCLAMGGLFAYDFYLYSEALLFHRIRYELWAARGAVAAMVTPFIAVSAARNPDWSVDIFVSRQVVFHSAALLGSGVYLLLMATVGYYIRYYGGEWGAVAQVIFLVGAFLVLVLVLFSGQIRARVRIFLNKNFFNYAYDYRQEWQRLIATLAEEKGLALEQRVILALGQVVESPSGVLWVRESTGRFLPRASYGDPGIEPDPVEAEEEVIQFMYRKAWIVNRSEMLINPEMYEGLLCPAWLEAYANAWLLVPLWGQNQTMLGLVLLTTPRTAIHWNWEVIDMLKTTSRLAASYLALEYAAKELGEARQFEGFNRLSAFVIHDLKNLIAQLSLVVRNADKHHDKPEFMRDAIQTVAHAVGKMNALMSQLRNSGPAASVEEVDLAELIGEVVETRSKQAPLPRREVPGISVKVRANRDRLASALEHVVHNAQDATAKTGTVRVRLFPPNGRHAVVEVADDGCGMDEEFVRNRLFRPFDTTKGLTGMGIGAYESREYMRALGGDLTVTSVPGKGSVFRFEIPVSQEKTEECSA